MKILITGATGFIGSALTEKLKHQGHQLYCLVRKTSKIQKLEDLNVNIVVADLTDTDSLEVIPEKIDIVFHLAANVDFSAISNTAKENIIKQNVNASENIFKAVVAKNPGLKKFIFFSSLAALGFQRGINVSNETEPHPDTIYGESKYLAEEKLTALSKRSDIQLIILRPSMVYGVGDLSSDFLSSCRMIKNGIFPVFGSGNNIMSPFIYINDLLDICSRFMNSHESGKFICTNNEKITVNQFTGIIASCLKVKRGVIRIPVWVGTILITPVEILYKILNKPAPLNRRRIIDLSVDRKFVNIHKDLRNSIDYEPETDFKTGSSRTVGWYKKNNLF